MTPSQDLPTTLMDQTARLRWWIYALLIALAAGMLCGRVLSVAGFNGDNDKSRWATIRALVDHHTYVIGQRVYFDEPGQHYEDRMLQPAERWDTIDKVLKPEITWRNEQPRAGEPLYARNFYSSKPPLLATVLAGQYWLLRTALGWEISGEDRQAIMRVIFGVTFVLPWTIALVLSARLVDRLGTTDLGRIAVVASLCFCTFFNAFVVTLNNHVVAMWSVVFALYPLAVRGQPFLRTWGAFVSGLFAGWATVNELPAAAFALLLAVWVTLLRPKALIPYLLGAVMPVAGLLLTNYLALETWIPAYDKFGTEWYRYPGSHWLNPLGLDASTDTLPIYLFHLTLGHHGLFSLTPVLLIALVGLAFPLMGYCESREQFRLRWVLGWGTLALSLVVLGFYLSKTDSYNYGGWTSGPRWFFWLVPLWLLGSLPAFDVLAGSRWGRMILFIAMGFSAFSVAYVGMNPWSHPWLFRWLEHAGWIRY